MGHQLAFAAGGGPADAVLESAQAAGGVIVQQHGHRRQRPPLRDQAEDPLGGRQGLAATGGSCGDDGALVGGDRVRASVFQDQPRPRGDGQGLPAVHVKSAEQDRFS